MNSLNKIRARAKQNRRIITLPEACDSRTLQATAAIYDQGLAEVLLVGKTREISTTIKTLGLPLDKFKIVDPELAPHKEQLIERLVSLRKHKRVTTEQAKLLAQNPLIYAAMMVQQGLAHGCVAGAVNTTSDVVRVALQYIGMKTGSNLVSSFFIMEHELPHQAIQGTTIYADCALVIDPDRQQLANIAIASADSARTLLGLQPKVALLSFSTAGSASHSNIDKVVEAAKIIRETRPDIPLMAEVQFDAAVMPEILAQKAPDIDLASPANVFIFPELQSANIGYKIAQRIGGVKAIGPILQGLKYPVNDLSRGCSVEDIVQLVAVTAIQSI